MKKEKEFDYRQKFDHSDCKYKTPMYEVFDNFRELDFLYEDLENEIISIAHISNKAKKYIKEYIKESREDFYKFIKSVKLPYHEILLLGRRSEIKLMKFIIELIKKSINCEKLVIYWVK